MNKDPPPSALVIPFGKHKGATVEELLAKDPAYAQWLLAQGWLAERFAELHSAILTRGANPDDSPEHNRIQARFLEPVFCAAFALTHTSPSVFADQSRRWREGTIAWNIRQALREGVGKPKKPQWDWRIEDGSPKHQEYTRSVEQWKLDRELWEQETRERMRALTYTASFDTSVEFEARGVDVVLTCGYGGEFDHRYCIEIKPTMGEDYPSVMRQMGRLGAPCLVIETYTGRALPFPTVRSMFAANNQSVVTVQEIEAEIPNARAMVL